MHRARATASNNPCNCTQN